MPAAGYSRDTLATILAIDTGTIVDRTSLFAEDKGSWYYLDLQATTGGETPTTGSGRWFKAGGSKLYLLAALSANQSLDSSTDDRIPFDIIEVDPESGWDTVNLEYVIPENGDYQVVASIRFGQASNQRYVFLAQNDNGTTTDVLSFFESPISSSSSGLPCLQMQSTRSYSAGDKVFVVYNVGPDSNTVLGSAAPTGLGITFLEITKVN